MWQIIAMIIAITHAIISPWSGPTVLLDGPRLASRLVIVEEDAARVWVFLQALLGEMLLQKLLDAAVFTHRPRFWTVASLGSILPRETIFTMFLVNPSWNVQLIFSYAGILSCFHAG